MEVCAFFYARKSKKIFPAIRREKYGGIPYRQMTAADRGQQFLLRRHFSVTPYLFYIQIVLQEAVSRGL